MFILVDCNNFFVSCERVFRPDLALKPVGVLSSNDGCFVSRSNEVKALGIPMGAPVFKHRELVKQHRIQVFSSNFTLYGDFSARVMQCLSEFSSHIEVYSIDEAFLEIDNISEEKLYHFGQSIRSRIYKWTGIPVSIGIGASKTQAKAANFLAKKNPLHQNCYLMNQKNLEYSLKQIPVNEIWGVGRAYTKFLNHLHVYTAWDLAQSPIQLIEKKMGIHGLRLITELNGESCLSLEEVRPPKKGICVSRSFGKLVTKRIEILEAVANHAFRAAEKLRKEKLAVTHLSVFMNTNRFRSQDTQYWNNGHHTFLSPTDDARKLVERARECAIRIFKPGYNYKKCGILLNHLVPQNELQLSFFEQGISDKSTQLMKTMDRINHEYGNRSIFLLAQGTQRKWRGKSLKRSPFYSTRWSDLPKI